MRTLPSRSHYLSGFLTIRIIVFVTEELRDNNMPGEPTAL